MAASEAQESKELFAKGRNIKQIHVQRGDILLHKKLRTEDGAPMVYAVKDVGRHTEGDRPMTVSYKSLYDGHIHFRPYEMFTSDRFCLLTTAATIDKALDKH